MYLQEMCQFCKSEPATVKVNESALVNEPDLPNDDHYPCKDLEDEGASDLSFGLDIDSEDEKTISPGDIVWAKYGKIWYPGKVVTIFDIPSEKQKKLIQE